MRGQRQHVRPTNPAPKPDDATPTKAEPRQHDFLATVYNVRNTLYSDQTGAFPQTSSRGNKYQMVMHEIDSNTTWVEPLPIKTEGSMITARARGLARMRANGLNPKHQILDNEASKKYKDAITLSGMTFQLVPPDDHRRNIAKKAIQFWG